MRPSTTTRQVTSCSAERVGDEVAIRVRDDGVGIEPNLLPHVFDLFTQADRSVARSHGGLGIGLTLVRTLVERHGGRVQASSKGPGQGAEFVVHLPALPTPPAEPSGRKTGQALYVPPVRRCTAACWWSTTMSMRRGRSPKSPACGSTRFDRDTGTAALELAGPITPTSSCWTLGCRE